MASIGAGLGAGEGRKTMGGKTLTRADLAEAVVQKVGLPRNESQELVELILHEISSSLAAGDAVKEQPFPPHAVAVPPVSADQAAQRRRRGRQQP